MSYPTVTIKRSARLDKATGIAQGRMMEGTIVGAFRTFQTFPAGSFGLKSLRNIILTPGSYYRAGTPVVYLTGAQVASPGSPSNTVNISCRQIIADSTRVGSAQRYVTFNPAFAATPVTVIMTPGSPDAGLDVAAVSGGTPQGFWIVESVDSGSFSHSGTPTATCYFEAIGPGSLSLNFVAMGP